MSSDLHRRLLVRCDPAWFGLRDNPPTVFAALRAAVELHTPELFGGIWACLTCSPGMPPQILIPAPCSTIRVIADALGVKDEELIEKESPTNG